MWVWAAAAALVLAGAVPLRADDAAAIFESAPAAARLDIGQTSLRPEPARTQELHQPPEFHPDLSAPAPRAHQEYGREGTTWLTVGGGAAPNFNGATDYNLHVAYSSFLVDRFEVGGELGVWHFSQPGRDAEGLSLHLLLRWHLVLRENWSFFLDTGLGVMGATSNVPSGGTGFDFMPRAGVGFTYRLTGDVRLETGLRWHHISNARIHGEARNPSRDAPMFYAGVIFPF